MGLQTILGANGSIGRDLAVALSQYTDRIRLVSRNPRPVQPTDELLSLDLSDPRNVEKAVEGSEIVYLVVGFAYNLKVWKKTWPPLMRAVIDACSKHGAKLVFFDNIYLYGAESIGRICEDAPINPPSKKGKVRAQIVQTLSQAQQEGKITALIARAPDFYGPGISTSLLVELIYNNLRKGKSANWVMRRDKKHSFIYTPDAAKATALLGNTPDAYQQVWHLPTDPDPLTGQQWTELFAELLHRPAKLQVLSKFMLRVLGIFMPLMREFPEMMYQYDRDYVFDSTKFQERFHFPITTYQEGARAIVVKGA